MVNLVSLRGCVIPLNICASLTKYELEKAKFLLCILIDLDEGHSTHKAPRALLCFD